MDQKLHLHILGVTSYPGQYGGFETLVNNLLEQNIFVNNFNITVYCSTAHKADHHSDIIPKNIHREWISFNANGISSLIFDALALIRSARHSADVILVLGVSGAFMFPLVRLFTRSKIVCNIDGLEWNRDKWNIFAKLRLKLLEWFAVKFAHKIIADNEVISQYLLSKYRKTSVQIAYGGDHIQAMNDHRFDIPYDSFDYALCRIEPENNISMIVEAYRKLDRNIVIIGNWEHSKFSQDIRDRCKNVRNIFCMPAIFEKEFLSYIRTHSSIYVHGHSAGGTNPSLVEAIHFDVPIIAFDCDFNRATLKYSDVDYFSSADELTIILQKNKHVATHKHLREKYSWKKISSQYVDLLCA